MDHIRHYGHIIANGSIEWWRYMTKHIAWGLSILIAMVVILLWATKFALSQDWLIAIQQTVVLTVAISGVGSVLFWVFCVAGAPTRIRVKDQSLIALRDQQIIDLEREITLLRAREEALKQSGCDMSGGEVYDYMKLNSGFETVREFETELSVKAYEEKLTVYAMAMDSTKWLQVKKDVFLNHTFRLAPKEPVAAEDDPWGVIREIQRMGGRICLETDHNKRAYECPQFCRAQIEFFWPPKSRV
jgi:hypothetical protein